MSRVAWLAAMAALWGAAPRAAGAQVGHAPERSPYRDLKARQAASVVVGYLTGSGGAAKVGPTDGPLFGVRYDRQVGTAVDIRLGVSYGRLQRYRVDPSRSLAARTTGPEEENIALIETGFSLILTGRKSWRGFVPYLGGGVGAALDTRRAEDGSGYSFGSKAILSPHLGVKWFPVQALALKLEGRGVIWRLSYPAQFFTPPVGFDVPPVLDPGTDSATEWTVHPTLLFSAGYTFTF